MSEKKIRRHWDEEEELWYFSIVDVILVLTDQVDYQGARNYWKVMKHRLVKEGNETVTNCNQLKMEAQDGKMRMTDVATTEQLFRLIQSVPSPKAEPFKLWLAKVGYERVEETEDPELAFERAMETYLKKGYSKNQIRIFLSEFIFILFGCKLYQKIQNKTIIPHSLIQFSLKKS